MPHDVLRQNQRELHGQCTITSVAYTKWGNLFLCVLCAFVLKPTPPDPDAQFKHRGTEVAETQRKT
jgi:hypothetical protein